MDVRGRRSEARPQRATEPFGRPKPNTWPEIQPGSWTMVSLKISRHRNREQSEPCRQSQGLKADCRLAGRAQAATNGKADDRRPGAHRAVARLGNVSRPAP